MLEKINIPEDLKELKIEDKKVLAKEIRELLINTVSATGGHLASNLGVVELTIAIHSIFNTPTDKIIWDVGHQTYVHKILTGRKEQMNTLRKMDGIAGFPKTTESVYDAFDTGHSSTSISVALGMARARDLKGEKNKIVAVIGDGALTGGMALEALNDAGSSKSNLIVILNDNEMSISKNVGGMSQLLGKLRTRRLYKKTNKETKKILEKIPYIGNGLVKIAKSIKRGIKQIFIQNMYFEDIGFTYFGPVDGNDIEKLESILNLASREEGPVLVHIITKKGKGYNIAEENPDKFHSISAFNIENGSTLKPKSKDYSKVFGDKIVDLADKDKTIVTITAAMCDGTGLTEFAKKYPDRFFDVGIAEQHAVGMIAGMAKNGLKPVLPVYSSFLQRAYDQVVHDICIQNLPVTICIDRAGIVGNDGETHQGILDLCFLNSIPNINILAPKDFIEFEDMLEFSIYSNKPMAIRYPRGGEDKYNFKKHEKIELGKAEVLKTGVDITIIALGKTVSKAMQIAEDLEKKNISVEVINLRFLKPIDTDTVLKSIEKTKNVITIEDGYLINGMGNAITKLIVDQQVENIKIKNLGYPDKFIKHGNVEEIEKKYKLDIESIEEIINTEFVKNGNILQA